MLRLGVARYLFNTQDRILINLGLVLRIQMFVFCASLRLVEVVMGLTSADSGRIDGDMIFQRNDYSTECRWAGQGAVEGLDRGSSLARCSLSSHAQFRWNDLEAAESAQKHTVVNTATSSLSLQVMNDLSDHVATTNSLQASMAALGSGQPNHQTAWKLGRTLVETRNPLGRFAHEN